MTRKYNVASVAMIDKRPGIPTPGVLDLFAVTIITRKARESGLRAKSVRFACLAHKIASHHIGERCL